MEKWTRVNIEALAIPDVKLITPSIFKDERGFFSETFNVQTLASLSISEAFVQDNHSLSVPRGVVRGLHFQIPPRDQAKLVRVVRGAILDVAVDIRHGSPTFGKHVTAVLSAANWSQLWIPRGFAHGFCTLEPDTEVLYKVTDYYAPSCDRGLRWDDPGLDIVWPISPDDAVLSAKDRTHPTFAELPVHFRYEAAGG
jgi:dTDP-4-dehydrorhamnose 3,5-epimerase